MPTALPELYSHTADVVAGGSLADGGCHVPRIISRSMLQSIAVAFADVSGTGACSASCVKRCTDVMCLCCLVWHHTQRVLPGAAC